MPEKTIAFTVDEEFHRDIKIRLAETGQTLKGYIINLIREDFERVNKDKEEYNLSDIEQKANDILRIINRLEADEKK